MEDNHFEGKITFPLVDNTRKEFLKFSCIFFPFGLSYFSPFSILPCLHSNYIPHPVP
jgi:hypothetical protein